MAKYTVTHDCGHDQVHELFGKEADRQHRIEWLTTTDCSDCYHAAKEAEIVAKSADLPALTGSEKQVAWANKLRVDMIDRANKAVDEQLTKTERNAPEKMADAKALAGAMMVGLRSYSDAKTWIDNRDASGMQLLSLGLKHK